MSQSARDARTGRSLTNRPGHLLEATRSQLDLFRELRQARKRIAELTAQATQAQKAAERQRREQEQARRADSESMQAERAERAQLENKLAEAVAQREQDAKTIETQAAELRRANERISELADEVSSASASMGEQTEDTREITVVERRFVLVTHKKHKYRCRCNAHIQTAPGPLKLIPGGRYALEFAIQVALDKYAYHLPLERQVRMMTRLGLLVDSQTLWDQIQALERLLNPAYVLIHAHILSAEVLYADETHWKLLRRWRCVRRSGRRGQRR